MCEKMLWNMEIEDLLDEHESGFEALSLAIPPDLQGIPKGIVFSLLGRTGKQVSFA